MKVLITGSEGFIGSHLVEELIKSGYKVRCFVLYNSFNSYGWLNNLEKEILNNCEIIFGDIRDSSCVKNAVRGMDVIIHLAALIGIPYSYTASESYIDTNIKGAFNVIQSCLDFKVAKVFHPTKPIFKNYWENTYTISKITAENFARMYRDVYNMDLTILRWLNASGPRQHLFPVRKFIPLSICNALLDRDIEIYGTGEQTIDIIDVRDIANIAIISTRSGIGKDKKVYDVGAGQALTCNFVAEKIIQMTNSKSKIKYLPMRVGEALDTKIVAVNHEELFKKLDLKLNFNYEQTLQDSIEFYKSLGKNYLVKSSNYFKV